MDLIVRAEHQSLWLCFEPWASEYTVMPGSAIVLRFADEALREVTHHRDGMTFLSLGSHPDLYAEDGTAVEIFSEYMPEFPADIPLDAFRFIAKLVPPIRSEPDRLN